MCCSKSKKEQVIVKKMQYRMKFNENTGDNNIGTILTTDY